MPCSLFTIFFFYVFLSLVIPPSSSLSDTLRQGESLSVEKQDDVLVSKRGIFSAGFYVVGQNACSFAIWFNDPPFNYQNRTLVWMANRDQPVNGKRSKLSLLKGGNLILFDAGRFNIWATDSVSRFTVFLQLKDNGNPLLMDSQNDLLWQSFDSPTDTLFPLQPFTETAELVSSRSQSNFSSGFYTFFFDDDNVIRMRFDNREASSVFWPPPWLVTWEAERSTYNNSRIAILNSKGNLSSSDDLTFLSADYGSIIQRRLKVDSDGNLRLYSRKGEDWVVSWQAFSDPCKIHGICGANGLCIYDHSSGRRCSCLPGYKMKDPIDWTRGNQRNSGEDIRDYLLAATGFRRFSFAELKKATKGFSEEIGRGSGGIVYKGVVSDGRVAAIKRLDHEAKQGEAEFLAEVNTIGRLNHMHLIETWGYCAEGKHRLLVYEYLEHGSLKQNLSGNYVLDWKKRYEVALGTAKGLAYLHEECLEWVLHCDVKPQNILLDSNYNPKVADFGLSKLLKRGELNNSRFSRIRGTRGYLAPEWVSNQPITSKVDVYSYGIVVLEMLTGRSPTTNYHAVNESKSGETTEHTRLVSWVQENIKGSTVSSDDFLTRLEKILDPSMDGEYDMKKMEKLLEVALKCVGEEKDARPTMSQVVEMLQDH
ncbi:hypothetical protein FNV43_RR11782 [Rhamnella rubrinervis]|uniref:non-specific serine/threonine protein kinase n=1 Tax=Rhamnella rubrinervis TaxID=2594499 RepID=A0A8K0MI18_9ROSA|nr:hypothetical protein FNV43_RR11782 [Rhamnella rubrinervis]